MTTPTQAPPEAVQHLSELPVFELTPDGTAKPLTATNQADPSSQASPNGAGSEAVASPAEPAPQPTATPQPTPQPAQPAAQQPAVQVVEPTPATTAQPEVTPAPAKTEPTPEDTANATARAEASLEQERQRVRDEATRAAQSAFDKRAAQIDRQLGEARERERALNVQIRELQANGLPEEERTKLLATFAREDERAELDSYRGQLVEAHRTLMVESLMLEFRGYGVTQDAVEQFASPEEMEAYCYEQKANFLENALNQARAQATQPAAPAPAQPASPAQPVAPVAQPQPNIPAGAAAPVDIGTGGQVQTGPTFNQGQGSDALRENLKNMRWDTVRINR